MEQKRTGLSYVFTLAKEERGKLSLGMLLAVFSSALSFVPYLVVYQILLLIIKQEVTLYSADYVLFHVFPEHGDDCYAVYGAGQRP